MLVFSILNVVYAQEATGIGFGAVPPLSVVVDPTTVIAPISTVEITSIASLVESSVVVPTTAPEPETTTPSPEPPQTTKTRSVPPPPPKVPPVIPEPSNSPIEDPGVISIVVPQTSNQAAPQTTEQEPLPTIEQPQPITTVIEQPIITSLPQTQIANIPSATFLSLPAQTAQTEIQTIETIQGTVQTLAGGTVQTLLPGTGKIQLESQSTGIQVLPSQTVQQTLLASNVPMTDPGSAASPDVSATESILPSIPPLPDDALPRVQASSNGGTIKVILSNEISQVTANQSTSKGIEKLFNMRFLSY
ncbi:hypothetical protein EDD86DRAFT_10462 [Gorgonomyces haynaldii]|nr:hypothetical protein EDD86DRAFT_10462 [Gorgonomyces haynaldii]